MPSQADLDEFSLININGKALDKIDKTNSLEYNFIDKVRGQTSYLPMIKRELYKQEKEDI